MPDELFLVDFATSDTMDAILCNHMQTMPLELLNAKECAKLLGISLRTLDTLAKKGQMPACIRIGKSRKWRRQDIENWIDQQAADNATSCKHMQINERKVDIAK